MKIMLLSFLLVLTSGCGKNSSGQGLERSQNEVTDGKLEADYLKLLNNYRTSLGLRELRYLKNIEGVASEHSAYMASGPGRLGHRGWKERCRRLNIENQSRSCGEIVAAGQTSPQAVLEAWVNSPSHRRMIESPQFTHTGLGIRKNDRGRIYWTQLFVEIP